MNHFLIQMKIDEFTFQERMKNCPICNGPPEDSFVSIDGALCVGGFHYSYCPSCDYYWLNPHPDFYSINNFYNYNDEQPLTEKNIYDAYSDYNNRGNNFKNCIFLDDLLKDLPKGSNLLDFGCGPGIFVYHNKQRWNAYGVEINKIACNLSQQWGITIFNSIEEIPDIKFNMITSFNVIEHMSDPKEFLLKLKQNLCDDGRILLCLPVIDGMLFDRKHPEQWKWVYSPYHLSMFSVKAIKRLASDCSLKYSIVPDIRLHATPELISCRIKKLSNDYISKASEKICQTMPLIPSLLRRYYGPEVVFIELRKK